MSITPLQGTLVLSADSTEVASGSTVTFTIDSSVVEGRRLPIVPDTTRWIPDADTAGGEYSEAKPQGACPFSSNPLKCAMKIYGDGRLEVVAHVNGFRHVASQAVKVRTAHLRLVASKMSVAKGENVSFTVTWSDGHTPVAVERWQFFPDSGTDITGYCPNWHTPTCTKAIQQSGTMTVSSRRDGALRTARARVNVVPCPTNDTLLDNPRVRKAIDSLVVLGELTSTQPKERRMEAFDSLGTVVVRFATFNPLTDNGCQVAAEPPLNGPDIRLAIFHLHTAAPGDTANCSPTEKLVLEDRFGGPSGHDWREAAKSGIREYVINPEGIQRMNAIPDLPIYWWKFRDGKMYPTAEALDQYLKDYPRVVGGCIRYHSPI